MSSWAQAAWIVKKIQKNFDFSTEIQKYINQLGPLATNIVNIENNLQDLEDDINNLTVVATKTNDNKPNINPSIQYKEGTLWLILES